MVGSSSAGVDCYDPMVGLTVLTVVTEVTLVG